MSDLKQTDLSKRLREWATSELIPAQYAEMFEKASDEIERYYTGMLNWKATAEEKDRRFAERRTQPEATAPAQDMGDRVDAELAFLNEWLTLAATPVGAECCGEGVTGAEYMGQREVVCCGSPIAVERGAEEVISAMAARHRELSAILQSQKAAPCEW